jgi:S1-C subfamily serine protease
LPQEISLKPAPLGDSSALQSGDWVIAVGCPVGLDFTVTLGIVSNPKRSSVEVGAPHLKGSYIQTDAALNSGNSGGLLY